MNTDMVKDFLLLVLKGIRHRPVRSWLTVLGIVIGIMLVVIILSLGSGLQNAVSNALQMFGSDLIIIFPGKETNPFAGLIGGQKFKERDLLELEKIEGVKFALPVTVGALNIEYKGEKKSINSHGMEWSKMRTVFEESQGARLESGSWPESGQDNKVVLGNLTANTLFKNKIRAGEKIVVQSKIVEVSGVLSRIGSQDDDNSVFLSWDAFHNISGLSPGAFSALVKIRSGANIDLVAQQVKYQLSKQEVVRDFSVLTPAKANRIVGNVLSIVEFFLIAIAFVSLAVGAVGIMNTMYTSVLERTKQIGIMKAVGASSDKILSLFLIESGIIGLVGGSIGIALGIFLSYVISLIVARLGVNGLFSLAALDYFGIFVVLIITFIAGVLSGILPARQAARMEPAEALRYE